jgi:hypothetical protein
MQLFDLTNQTKNLTTFVFGTLLHTMLYSYLGSLNLSASSFMKTMFGFYSHILFVDIVAIGIIYKNYYNESIVSEFTNLVVPIQKQSINIPEPEPEPEPNESILIE